MRFPTVTELQRHQRHLCRNYLRMLLPKELGLPVPWERKPKIQQLRLGWSHRVTYASHISFISNFA